MIGPKDSHIAMVIRALVTSIAANIASIGLIQYWVKIKHMIGF
jgi:hypothetical protein